MLADEMADVLWVLTCLANQTGIDLTEAMARNMEKKTKRSIQAYTKSKNSTMKPIIECVPNFSEGKNKVVIDQICQAIAETEGVSLLNVDPGAATNRTVVTFTGHPDAVVEAAFRGIKKAAELIDMTKHKGEHPRMGATDVCPLIPISGITMEETAKYAEKLGERVGKELNIPVYLYEAAAKNRKDKTWLPSGPVNTKASFKRSLTPNGSPISDPP